MRLIRLSSEIDFAAWRNAARALAADGVAPEEVEWAVGDGGSLLGTSPYQPHAPGGFEMKVPRAFVGVAERAILHSHEGRFALLYRLLWRLRNESRLMSVASDPDVARVQQMAHAVDREIHKTHAFVRFRKVADESGEVYVAWFEPVHHTLEAAAPFFVRRFASMRWSILTPRVCAHWNGSELEFTAGAARETAPAGDALETLWRTYYASIFNPARLKTGSMKQHMPRKYWSNMPETALIGELIAQAGRAPGEMIERAPTEARLRVPTRPASEPPLSSDLPGLAAQAGRCTACPLYAAATQTVFGEGPADAAIMFVGEQPGDQEDLAGRPFVGPAGQLFDRALAQAGIDRARVYVTNAVKHFKFEPRGKRRLHKTPGQIEIEACRQWLEREIAVVQPRLIVTLGSTAAHSVLGKPTPIQRNRGKRIRVSDQTDVLVTVHPSYLLRIPEDEQPAEYARFVEDLKLVRPAVL